MSSEVLQYATVQPLMQGVPAGTTSQQPTPFVYAPAQPVARTGTLQVETQSQPAKITGEDLAEDLAGDVVEPLIFEETSPEGAATTSLPTAPASASSVTAPAPAPAFASVPPSPSTSLAAPSAEATTTAPRGRKPRQPRTSGVGTEDGHSTSKATTSASVSAPAHPHSTTPASAKPESWPSINITLPPECHQWFVDQAAAAPYEPTLAKYLQWQLREMWKQHVREAEAIAAEEAAEARARAEYNDGKLGPQ